MPRFFTSNHLLGAVCIAAAILALFVWIPLDVETGLVEKVRRQVQIGDSLLPTLACGFVIFGGLLLLAAPTKEDRQGLSRANLYFLLILFLLLVVAFAVMRWLGPFLVWSLTDDGVYRTLRDTTPWKHMGFVTGGTLLVAGIMALVEGRVTLRGVLIGLLSTLTLIAVYDLPFEDLLLPPNGDV